MDSEDITNKPKSSKRGAAMALHTVVLILACVLLVFAVVTAVLCFAGCGGGQAKPSPTDAPSHEQAAFELTHLIRYWPEDADYTTCDYACIIEQPVFSRMQTAGDAMNEAVEGYIERLYSRVENEYMAISVAKPPYTDVDCRIEYNGEYTNVIFTEEHCYEAQPYKSTYVLILNERGEEVNCNDVFRTYHADDRIAAALIDMMAESGYCYDGIELNSVLAKLDIAHGCLADDSGATVFLPEGVFAPYDYGELSFKVPAALIDPAIVENVVTQTEYDNICRLTDAVSSACIVRETNVEGGVMTEYAATAFMGAVIQRSDFTAEKGRISVPASEFEGLYRSCFGQEFPGIDTDGFDIRLEDGAYTVSSTQKVYEYHLDMLGAVREGDVLTIKADLVFGGYGYPYSTPVCHVTVKLTESETSPYGFELIDYIMDL